MAVTHSDSMVLWGGSASTTVVYNGVSGTSDAFTIDATVVAASVQLMSDQSQTPASGDTTTFYIAYSNGDHTSAGVDDFDTLATAQFLCQLDNYTTTGGIDPAFKTVAINTEAKSFKIIAVNNSTTSGHTITISARVTVVKA